MSLRESLVIHKKIHPGIIKKVYVKVQMSKDWAHNDVRIRMYDYQSGCDSPLEWWYKYVIDGDVTMEHATRWRRNRLVMVMIVLWARRLILPSLRPGLICRVCALFTGCFCAIRHQGNRPGVQTSPRSCMPSGKANHLFDLCILVGRCLLKTWCSFLEYTFELHRAFPTTKADVLETLRYGCVTQFAHVTPRHAASRSLLLPDLLHWIEKAQLDRPLNYLLREPH